MTALVLKRDQERWWTEFFFRVKFPAALRIVVSKRYEQLTQAFSDATKAFVAYTEALKRLRIK